ncbi:helix-turn-helix transcriptional regulator [Fictibacillus gelatini]|uniref:helix-turn-helix transcriptional regulator n=1 Tax=Fictibacillus gelatini TaxID=225985 RepID=UPI0003FAE029|nr:helix-turn-helix transcriptional regulator [Fictibacillus gelatini]
MKFKCRLKIIYAEDEITQEELSEKTGISSSTLSALANNKQLPTFTNAYIISDAVKRPINEIWVRINE